MVCLISGEAQESSSRESGKCFEPF